MISHVQMAKLSITNLIGSFMVSALPKVYIVILNWNGWQDTTECVESCLMLQHANSTVLIVDNNSSDGSEAILRERFPHVELIQTQENLGYAGGNNAGIRHALANGAEYIWLLNNDTKVDPAALEEMLCVASQNPDVGMVGPKILLYSRPEYLNCIGSTINLITGRPSLIGLGEKDDGRFDAVGEMDTLSGCSLLVRKEVIDVVGFLDESFFLFYEETDWILRAKRAGYRMLYVPKARIWHKVSASVGGHQSPLMLYYMTRNNPLLMRKNVGRLAFVRFMTIYLCLVIPKKMINVLLFNKDKRCQKVTAIGKGLRHYFTGRFGVYS
jgi:GT2 family glycosyltransferase